MIDLFRTRRSIIKYENRIIEPEKIEILKEVLLRSPTSRDNTPWEFIFIQNKEMLIKLYDRRLESKLKVITGIIDKECGLMKKFLFVFAFVVVAMVFSITVMAQSGTDNVGGDGIKTENTADQVPQDSVYDTIEVQLDNGEYCGWPCPQCPGPDSLNQLPAGCCQALQYQSAPAQTPEEPTSTVIPGRTGLGCCSR